MSDTLRQRLCTVQLVPLTAFDEGGNLNLDPMRTHIRRLYDAGIRTFIPCAGSSEFHVLSIDEIVATIEMTREVVGDDAVVVAPIGFRTEHALELGNRAVEAGADCALVMPLVFPYLSDVGAKDYYLELLDNLDCPVLIYKKAEIPSDDLLLELADHEKLIGVKYAVNEMDAFNTAVQRDGGRLEWFCGNAERYAPFFALAGSTGYTSGAGNLCPRTTLAMHATLAAGNWDEALRLQKIILPIEHFRARCGNSFNISFLKYAIKQTGVDFGEPRPPYRRLTDAQRAEIDAMLPAIFEAENELAGATAAVS